MGWLPQWYIGCCPPSSLPLHWLRDSQSHRWWMDFWPFRWSFRGLTGDIHHGSPDQLCVVALSLRHRLVILPCLGNFGRHVTCTSCCWFSVYHHIPSIGWRGKLLVGSVLILVVVFPTLVAYRPNLCLLRLLHVTYMMSYFMLMISVCNICS